MVNVIALLSLLLLSATAPVAWARDDCDQVQIDAGECDAEASGKAAPDEASADAEPAENSAILSEGSVAGEGEGSQEGRDTGSSDEAEADSVGDASSQPEPSIPPPVATPAPEPALSVPASAAPARSGFGSPRPVSSPATNLYVGNLSFSVLDEDLRRAFGEFGVVVFVGRVLVVSAKPSPGR
jgi:hypothetical protein